MISFIVAFDPEFGIGVKGKLPWHIKDDLKLFRQNTLNKNIIMGQTTYDNLPAKLEGRHITVVSLDPNYQREGVEVIHDLIPFLKKHMNDEDEYLVCGGASIYRQAYPYAKKAYVSFIKEVYDVDTKLDVYYPDDWEIVKEVDYPDFIYRELKRV